MRIILIIGLWATVCGESPNGFYPYRIYAIGKSYGRSVPKSAENYPEARATDLATRSYYGTPLLPALYPAVDTVSVLASLAFLAFLLHTLSSLFERSRSLVTGIVRERRADASIENSLDLVLRGLDE